MIYWCTDAHIERPFLSHHFVTSLTSSIRTRHPTALGTIGSCAGPFGPLKVVLKWAPPRCRFHVTAHQMTMEAHHKKNHDCMWYSTASNVAKTTSNNLISSGYCIASRVPTWWNVETCFSRVVCEWRDHPLVAIGSWCSDLSTLFHHTTLFSKYFGIAAWHF